MYRATALAAALSTALFGLPAGAEMSAQGETVTVWEVDTSGRPPFKRTRVELPVADVASLESADVALETRRVWTTDFRGRPPFRRGYEELPVVDAASLEYADTGDGDARPKPFFKRRHR